SPGRIVPTLPRIEDRHRHRGTGRQVSGMQGVRIGKEVEFEGGRIREEGGVDVSPIAGSDRCDGTQSICLEDPRHARPNSPFGDRFSVDPSRHRSPLDTIRVHLTPAWRKHCPVRVPVGLPSSTAAVPFTKTQSLPTGNSRGYFSNGYACAHRFVARTFTRGWS